MWSQTVNSVLPIVMMLTVMTSKDVDASTTTTSASKQSQRQQVGRSFFENTLFQLVRQRRFLMDGFNNATSVIERGLSLNDALALVNGGDDNAGEGGVEARGPGKKKLKQMNRTLIAIVMAYSLKFMFLIPTFIGTLIMLKFTTGLAGFFYALFAAVLSLVQPDH